MRASGNPKWNLTPEIDNLYQELMEELSKTFDDNVKSIEDCINISERKVVQLRTFLNDYSFVKLEDEILFFKQIKPAFCAQLVYYRKIYRIVLQRPVGGIEQQARYLKRELSFIQYFFESNIDLYSYIRSEAKYLDEFYFTRKPLSTVSILHGSVLDGDPAFCTPCDHEVASIFANDLLKEYLLGCLDQLNDKFGTSKGNGQEKSVLTWTASLAAINELIYGLKVTGAINNGNVTLAQIASGFEKMLNVKVGNHYRRQQENRLRQERTPFLHSMIKKSDEEMDFRDENPHRSSK